MITDARIARIIFVLMPVWMLVGIAATSGPVLDRLLPTVNSLTDAAWLGFAWFLVSGMFMAKYWYVTLTLLAVAVMVLILHWQNRIVWD